jgi:hypothetical protein
LEFNDKAYFLSSVEGGELTGIVVSNCFSTTNEKMKIK